MPAYVSTQFFDVEDQAASVGDAFEQNYRQLSRGRFQGEMTVFNFSECRLYRERTNRRLEGAARSKNVSFWWLWDCTGTYRCNGLALRPDAVVVGEAGADFELISDPSDLIAIDISAEALRDWCLTVEGLRENDLPSGTSLRLLAPSISSSIRTALETLFAAAAKDQTRYECSTGLEPLRDRLLSFCAAALQGSILVADAPSRRTLNLTRITRRAIDMIENYSAAPVTIPDLCRGIGTSRRNLHYAFLAETGLAPAAYIRMRRLHGVRHDLRRRSAGGFESIADVAARWGFLHPSNFANLYRRYFGELPSNTAAN